MFEYTYTPWYQSVIDFHIPRKRNAPQARIDKIGKLL